MSESRPRGLGMHDTPPQSTALNNAQVTRDAYDLGASTKVPGSSSPASTCIHVHPSKMASGLSSPVVRLLIASSPLWIPAAFAIFQLDVDWTFSPRAIVYSDRIAPIFFAPFAKPETWSIALSRFLQLGIMLHFSLKDLGLLWTGWIALALFRSITGHLLTRSVGWAYPSLFSHWALYESASGIGPILVAHLVLNRPSVLAVLPAIINKYASHRHAIPVLTIALCWLECRPWTYGTALFAVLPMAIARKGYLQYSTLPKPNVEKQKRQTLDLHQFVPCCLVILIPWLVVYHIVSPARLPLPTTSEPLLDILMLSHPRPVPIETSINIINTTVQSFVPFLSPAVTLSLFTHASDHEALRLIQQSTPQITVRVDSDNHPDDIDGHYLHLAEAFRWMLEDSTEFGEWMMLVEDDFPVCFGSKGWDVITTVVEKLEADRLAGHIRSGFVGTGGSGIILHRSYLPTLIFLLRSLSTAHSPLHPDVIRRLPDQIIHDCILGRRYSFCERHDSEKTKLLISSRLVLDHIGGMATTSWGKPGNTDKWRCGWRHAFHGDEAVEVMIV